MFEEYLQDSYEFFRIAQQEDEGIDEDPTRSARRYYRASAFYAAGAMEAFINHIADVFAEGGNLQPHEADFLNDRAFTPRKGKWVEQTRYYSVEDKLRFLILRFVPSFDFGTNPSWARFLEFKGFRDSLVHPRQSEDETGVADYAKIVRGGISGAIELMNEISMGVFEKPLRKQLTDLIPE